VPLAPGTRIGPYEISAQIAPSRVNVVLNWLDDLKPLAPSK
jgi:hypothetical protein